MFNRLDEDAFEWDKREEDVYPYCYFVSNRERSRMMGFPDSFKYSENRIKASSQLANAIPPPIVSVVASDIISRFNPKVSLSHGWSAAAQMAISSSNTSSDISTRSVDLPTGKSITIRQLAEAEDGSLGF
eukprot:TRINITY_DN17527_c0_g1_i1.p1 TRINITY_DN17527_c0_g1~~TRINITY_DN17527_c0_g1_i1.p1  ORF type:complete len:130 (+),score=29.76 TRINITY_DN17527_c0_g1_i1:573-962(+)